MRDGQEQAPALGRGLPTETTAEPSAILPVAIAFPVVVAAERQPVLGARRRLRHRPAVGLADVVGALPVGAPTVAEVVLAVTVALLLQVRRLGRRVAARLVADGRVGVGGSGPQRLRHPPLGDHARTGPNLRQIGTHQARYSGWDFWRSRRPCGQPPSKAVRQNSGMPTAAPPRTAPRAVIPATCPAAFSSSPPELRTRVPLCTLRCQL
jgi:hypothetical protein